MRAEAKVRQGLSELMAELTLLRGLEMADRAADPVNCPKSLRQKEALRHLDDWRSRP